MSSSEQREDQATTRAHTPGPWRVWREVGLEIFPDCSGTRIALVTNEANGPKGITPAMGEANARLIAAAPDLLAALKAFVDDVTDADHSAHDWSEQVVLKRARAAIAKATGEQ